MRICAEPKLTSGWVLVRPEPGNPPVLRLLWAWQM